MSMISLSGLDLSFLQNERPKPRKPRRKRKAKSRG